MQTSQSDTQYNVIHHNITQYNYAVAQNNDIQYNYIQQNGIQH
jgi:hypothetical protein